MLQFRYNFVVNENAVISGQNREMELELKRFQGQMDASGQQILRENGRLREENERLNKMGGSRGISPGKTVDLRVENKLNLEVQRLRKEIEKLKE